jgi:hypothetical protein
VVSCDFGSFSFLSLGRLDSPLSNGQYLFHGTCNREACLDFGPCCDLILSSRPWPGDDLS